MADPTWRKIRGAVLKRDNYTCQICGAPASEVHHRIKRYYPRPSAEQDFDNLIAVCKTHGAMLRARR